MTIRRFQNKSKAQNSKQKKTVLIFVILILICIFEFWILNFAFFVYAQESRLQPIIINGDVVEYSTDAREVTVAGNAEVIYQDTTLTCDQLTVNTGTKDAVAEGSARMENKQGVIEGSKMIYNFETKVGVVMDPQFRSNPYFGQANKLDKVSDTEFIARHGYVTTCDYDLPHYRIKSRKINFFPDDKIQTKDDIFYVGKTPLLYLPQYNHSLKDPLMHVQLMPGKSKDWGVYTLSAWRYNLTENVTGRIYLDYRERLGIAEGFGSNYTTQGLGKGDFKYYYSQERSRRFEEGQPAEFQRYFIRWRHQWDMDKQTKLTAEYYKIIDSKRMIHGTTHNILKDYFPREYEKDAKPLTYALFHHDFDYSILDILMQKRINRWYSQTESLPEIKYSLPSIQIGESPFYFENTSSYINYNSKNAVPSDSWNDVTYDKFDITNKLSLSTRLAFINLTPFISSQQVFNDKSTYGSTLQTVFSGGTDMSTKFYRLFNLKSNFLGLDINDLRHIITPAINYTYTHDSGMPSSKARFGGGASVGNGSLKLQLSNKLQTKRQGQKVDIADFRINTSYAIKPESGTRKKSTFSDFLFDLELLPYAWLRIDVNTTYQHSGGRSDANYRHFSNLNYDINFDFGEERSFGFGQRYQRKGGNNLIYNLKWRFNPKWKISLYHRIEHGHDATLKSGLREQEYILSRDLHCWTVEFTYNVRRFEGETIWMVFRLKAFPEIEFEFNRAYHAPKAGSQTPGMPR